MSNLVVHYVRIILYLLSRVAALINLSKPTENPTMYAADAHIG